MGQQYDKFLLFENFKLAFARIVRSPRNEYKEFYDKDIKAFEYRFEDNIKQLINEIKEELYEPQMTERYYIPKSSGFVRPITLLNFLDYLVYQSLANIVADVVHGKVRDYFNVNTFGNIFKRTNDSSPEFFFESWKKQWKCFNDTFKKTYNNGYKYCVKFDMASFFDLIDHETLSQIMLNNGIDEDIVMILKRCLGKWAQTTIMFDENYNKTHGLPQGPLCSSFFAELYLFPLDALMRRQSGVKYFRYVDDINLMVQSVERGNKLKLFLELAIRDLGLIPQNTKVNVQKIENIDKHMQQKFNNFSVITRHFKSNGRLNEGEHNRLKNKIKRCIEAKEIDKTLINFSLYKLNKDDEIKKMLLDNKELFTSYFQPVTSYLNRCFPSDDKVIDFIIRYISSEEELFQYNKAILVGKYGTLPFNEKILEQCDHDKSWILKYRMFQWLYRNEKKEILNGYHVNDKDNYFMQQILLWVKIKSMQDSVAKKQLLRKYIFNCKNNNDAYMLSIQGYFLWNEEFQYEPFDLHSCDGGNRYIRRYVTRRDTDYFRAKMKEIYAIDIPQDFIEKVKEKSGYYEELERAFKGFIMLKKIDTSSSVQNLDIVNSILLSVLGKDFSSMDSLMTLMPVAINVFKKVHNIRSEATLAHPYRNRSTEIRKIITYKELAQLLNDNRLKEAYTDFIGNYRPAEIS